MTEDVQPDAPPDPVDALRAALAASVPSWLRRVTLGAAARSSVVAADFTAAVDEMVVREAPRLLADLDELLAADVDEQTTNPLSVLRSGVSAPTELLRAHGVEPPTRDAFGADHFPDDVYRLGPATWADVDPSLHEPGLTWGAWKAMTVLRRRRDEGLR